MKSEIRKSYLLEEYVIITPGRKKRPRDIKEETSLRPQDRCVFCPKGIEKSVLIKKYNHPDPITLLKNKFPAVTLGNPKAFGKQEVIVETEKHGVQLSALPVEHIEKIIGVYSDRTKELMKNKKLDYILIFKNQGSKAGASLLHAHSQVFATEIVAPDVRQELIAAHEYQLKNNSCVWCEVIKKESHSSRLIGKDRHAIAFAPYASKYHYEAWIFPFRHLDNLTTLNQPEINSIAKLLKKITTKLDAIGLSYNFFMHQVVTDYNQHFCIKIQPRDSVWAGVELGSGIVINSVPPEQAAKYYRS